MKKKSISIRSITLFICLIYILLRPFLNTYLTESVKYIFVLVMVYYAVRAITSKRILREIGYGEIALCLLFILYVLMSSFIAGGVELIVYSLERYIFYMIPLLVIPVIERKVHWERVLNFLTWYGIIDSIISITEFIIHRQLIPIGGVTHSVVQPFGDDSIRTFGLNGDYFLLAELLCLCGFSSLYLFIKRKRKIDLIKFLIITFGILTTGSRGYYASFSVGIAVFYTLYNLNEGKPSKFILKVAGATIIGILLLFLIFMTNITTGISAVDTILERARSIIDFSGNYANAKRLQHWYYSINKWNLHPLFGNGASVTDMRYSKFEMVTESGLFKRLVELGIVGTLLQYLTMLVPAINGYKLFRKTRDPINLFYIFCFSLIATLATEDMVLQRYGEVEFTIVIWSALAFVATLKKERKGVVANIKRCDMILANRSE